MSKKKYKAKAHVSRRQIYQLKRSGHYGRFYSPIFKTPKKKKGGRRKFNYTQITAPTRFNLQYENCEKVIQFINHFKKLVSKGKNIEVNLEKVEDIREGAIAMLLSVVDEATRAEIKVRGNTPRNWKARTVFEKSGFFRLINNSIIRDINKSKNIMIKTGERNTSQNVLALEIRNAMETVWGIKGRNPSVYTTAFEMMRNSCDHAFREDEKVYWHFAISHDEENHKVKFAFVDNGKGIVKTLRENVLKQFVRQFTGNTDIIDTAFKNGIESRTGLKWRGKGLPNIYESFDEKYIKNLLVISNNVFIHFDNEIKKEIRVSFEGTYYYWEVDTSCVKACFA